MGVVHRSVPLVCRGVGPQFRRFRTREKTPYKKHKITDEDYRNRKRRPDYERAVDEMVASTHRPGAAWHLVASNDKKWARIQVLSAMCAGLERRL